MSQRPDLEPIDHDELDFIADSQSSVLAQAPAWMSMTLWLVMLFIFIGLIWASFATLDEVTIGEGKVIPSSSLQVVQNLEGGIIAEIKVAEGDIVEKGQTLIKLDDTRFSASYKEAVAKRAILEAMIARFDAQANQATEITFLEGLTREHPELVKREEKLFQSYRETMSKEIATLKKSYELANKELTITKPLVEEGVMSEVELLRLQRQVNEAEGKINETRNKFRDQSLNDLNRHKAELSTLTESMQALKDRMVRTVIKAPVKGIIHNLRVSTVGEVVKPGAEIMDLVPLEGNLTVEVNIRPSDIAFIHPSQKATIKVSAYDFSIYGGLPAKVETISADTIKNEKDQPFYEVKLTTQQNFLGNKEAPLPIIPGMTVTAHILTGEKTVLDYLLKPILRARERALTER